MSVVAVRKAAELQVVDAEKTKDTVGQHVYVKDVQSTKCDDINPSIEKTQKRKRLRKLLHELTSDEQCVEEEIITDPFDECFDIV